MKTANSLIAVECRRDRGLGRFRFEKMSLGPTTGRMYAICYVHATVTAGPSNFEYSKRARDHRETVFSARLQPILVYIACQSEASICMLSNVQQRKICYENEYKRGIAWNQTSISSIKLLQHTPESLKMDAFDKLLRDTSCKCRSPTLFTSDS